MITKSQLDEQQTSVALGQAQVSRYLASVEKAHLAVAGRRSELEGQVEGIVEATGEAQGSLFARDDNVRQTTGQNVNNKHHFVRLKLEEGDDYDLPVGAVGLACLR